MSLVFLLLLGQGALSSSNNTYHITTAEDLIQLSNSVNSEMNFEGTTVFLDADIDFSGSLSEQFEPIGKDMDKGFQGTFDGQGYIISNLAINSSSLTCIGLFGYSKGATFRNVILDSSSSVVSSYSGPSSVYAGGVVGSLENAKLKMGLA